MSQEELAANQTAHVTAAVLDALRNGNLSAFLASRQVALQIDPAGADGRIIAVNIRAERIDTLQISELPKEYSLETTVAIATEITRL